MRAFPRRLPFRPCARLFSSSASRRQIIDLAELPDRTYPMYKATRGNDLLSLQWPSPLQNVLLVRKDNSQPEQDALIEFAEHLTKTYPTVSLLAEPYLAATLHRQIRAPIYSSPPGTMPTHAALLIPRKTDLVCTFGGDGTILRASSLFSSTGSVPPLLSFSMGTLGFLGEWTFAEHAPAFRQVYFSGAGAREQGQWEGEGEPDAWSSSKGGLLRGLGLGQSAGGGATAEAPMHASRVLLRRRLKLALYDAAGQRISPRPPDEEDERSGRWRGIGKGRSDRSGGSSGGVGGGRSSAMAGYRYGGSGESRVQHALNEVLLHRGPTPHLALIQVSVNGRVLTEAVADGILVSTPTGSTAYALSAGGSIIHPLVPALVVTPICPRSLSFRPLVLPMGVEVALRISEANRAGEVAVDVDGVRRAEGLSRGMEVRVTGEVFEKGEEGWGGGVACIVKGGEKGGDDGWVGGLNQLLKFNYPFGEVD